MEDGVGYFRQKMYNVEISEYGLSWSEFLCGMGYSGDEIDELCKVFEQSLDFVFIMEVMRGIERL